MNKNLTLATLRRSSKQTYNHLRRSIRRKPTRPDKIVSVRAPPPSPETPIEPAELRRSRSRNAKPTRREQFEDTLLRTKKNNPKASLSGSLVNETVETLRFSKKPYDDAQLMVQPVKTEEKIDSSALHALERTELNKLITHYFRVKLGEDKRYDGVDAFLSPEKRARTLMGKVTSPEDLERLDLRMMVKHGTALSAFYESHKDLFNTDDDSVKRDSRKSVLQSFVMVDDVRLSDVSDLFFSDHDSILDIDESAPPSKPHLSISQKTDVKSSINSNL